jgi:hypothetical protein
LVEIKDSIFPKILVEIKDENVFGLLMILR